MNSNLISEPWFNRIGGEFSKPYFLSLKEQLREEYKNFKIFPAPAEIFKAFQLTPPEQVRVVMILQD